MTKIILIIIFALLSLISEAQNKYTFNHEKWIDNPSDSLCKNYRGCCPRNELSDLIIGKNRKHVKRLLGEPDIKGKEGNSNQIIIWAYHVYKDKNMNKNGKVYEGPLFYVFFYKKKAYEIADLMWGG